MKGGAERKREGRGTLYQQVWLMGLSAVSQAESPWRQEVSLPCIAAFCATSCSLEHAFQRHDWSWAHNARAVCFKAVCVKDDFYCINVYGCHMTQQHKHNSRRHPLYPLIRNIRSCTCDCKKPPYNTLKCTASAYSVVTPVSIAHPLYNNPRLSIVLSQSDAG